MGIIDTLLGLALAAFSLFLQLMVAIFTFFLIIFQTILSALHLQ